MSPDQVTFGSFFSNLLALFGAGGPNSLTSLNQFATHLWLWITVLSYLLSLGGLVMLVYILMRIYEVRKREEAYYGTMLLAPESTAVSPRWAHIQSLIAGTSPSEWREAIVEADIMLDDMLMRQGYGGDGVGEKLQQVERADFNTLQDAGEAHKVRNQVAHKGSTFDLSETLARRTIARYEAVFREFGAI